jgi:CheY-like chemotaxis protein
LALIRQHRPDLICLDVSMPSGSGLAVCEMLANDEELCSVPVIMLTGSYDDETIRRCHSMSAHYVLKSRDVWRRLEPVVSKLLGIQSPGVNTTETPGQAGRGHSESAPSCPNTDMLRRTMAQEVVYAQAAEEPRTSERNRPAPADQAAWEHADEGEESQAVPAPRRNGLEHLLEVIRERAAATAAAPHVLTQGATRRSEESHRPRVLYVEDDLDESNALRIRLESLGVDVIQAFNGMDGYRMAVANEPDLILCDFMMPEGEGDYALRRFQENPVTQNIPVIFLTGRQGSDLKRRLYAQGAAGFLTKPVDWEELVHHLGRFVKIDKPKQKETVAV